jgi:hypothetical protein
MMINGKGMRCRMSPAISVFFNSTLRKKKLETMRFLKIFDALPVAKRNPNNDAHRSS